MKSQRWYEDNPTPRYNYNNDPFAEGARQYQQELINKATLTLRNENELLRHENYQLREEIIYLRAELAKQKEERK